ncbi:MAG: hypothetical protein NC548_48015, partial [Lachnospiraceae bacterium]|nr:hypothetical protein [Lachnospiraceae bacterium]
MPVQDEFKPKKAENVQEKEEEKRQKNDVKPPENNIQKSQKLMPFLSGKAETHQSKINSIDVKIATKEDKISRNEAKIERLTAKADRLEDRNTMLKNMFGNVPAVRKIIESNEKKIENIRNVKIPKRQEKIKIHKQKIAVLSGKRDKTEHKLNRVIALNDAVKSFSIGLNSERREIFSNAMNRLNTANADCFSDKISALQSQKQRIIEEYNRPETSIVDKLKLTQKLKNINGKIHDASEKMQKFVHSENNYSEKSADVVDAKMKVTSDKFADISESETYTIPEITENIISAADSVDMMDKNKISEIAADFNSLDGNSKSELENMQKFLSETLSAMKEISGNKYMMQSVRESTAKEIPQIEAQLNAVNQALEKLEISENKSKSVVIGEDGSRKVNMDFYNSVPKNERFIVAMTIPQAEKVMDELANQNIEFSAVTRGEKAVVMVAEKNSLDLQKIIGQSQNEINQEFHDNSRAEKTDFKPINPDFYKSLPKENRSINVETKENAEKIMSQLAEKNIAFSAVECKNNKFAITVAKEDENAYKSVANEVKGERAVQYINADFYKSLPKNERASQGMSQENAEQKISELSSKNIPHSAILNGEKSVVTVAKKDEKTAFFSRDKLKQSA